MPPPELNIPRPAPLAAVLLITLVLSIGTGAVTIGLYFVATQACGFSRTERFLLGVVIGASYIPAALAAGPVLKRLAARGRRLTPRTVLLSVVLGSGLVAIGPPLLAKLGAGEGAVAAGIWLVGAAYGALTGLMWPIVEWFLAGGRKQRALRAATGRFNITWTTAVVLAMWIMAPILGQAASDPQRALDMLIVIAGLHALGAVACLWLPGTPAAVPVEHHSYGPTPHPAIASTLLAASRRLLPASYVLMAVLGPYFPGALTDMGVEPSRQTLVVSAWMLARVAAMVTLERWHGWHNRPAMLIVGAAALLLGFSAAVLAPWTGSLVLVTASLALFGCGMGIVYTAALYYALELEDHGASAGGTHEALIGIGYAAGPAIGLAASIAIDRGGLDESSFGTTIVGAAIALTLTGLAVAFAGQRR
ncbi:MAG: hypothetical protein AAGB48_06240 [Planctomycetota bacterium]